MKPTVGRIVHYRSLGSGDGKFPPETQAAIITAVKLHNEFQEGQPPADYEENTYQVSLHIFYTTGQFDMPAVPWSLEYKRGHWTWPPKV